MKPEEFVKKWEQVELKESASAHSHFEDVCRLVGHALPAEIDPTGEKFTYEKGVQKASGGQGYADVWYDGHFAIEYKSKGKDLKAAYQQLLQYRERLRNPPLLVVCDIDTWEIHTNFDGAETKVYTIKNEELIHPSRLKIIHALFHAPATLHPRRNTEDVTREAAEFFRVVAENMRNWHAEPERIARFLTKVVFCLFAEDVNLLPAGPKGETGIFSEIVERNRGNPAKFMQYTRELFEAMAVGGDVLMEDIPYFNGALFEDVQVEELSLEALTELERACRLNWASVNPSIFGTLFERSLDPAKRSQLGAHYTGETDILDIVEPVLMQPLRREWQVIQKEAAPWREKLDSASTRQKRLSAQKQLETLREKMLNRLRSMKVLDPACGSGNFLYVSLRQLLDMEKAVITHELWRDLTQPLPEVHPRQMFGLEIAPIAHALASIVVWIGYLQWRNNNGFLSFKEPILENLQQNIVCRDAILDSPLPVHGEGSGVGLSSPLPLSAATERGSGVGLSSPLPLSAATERGSGVGLSSPLPLSAATGRGSGVGSKEPEWPAVDVIVGNPPFLGGSKILSELGEAYQKQMWAIYNGRVPGFADLVCYWFERARFEIEQGRAKRAGLLATNSIRGGANREVLNNIKQSGDIFMAWADRPWILEGAAVRVSMVGFDNGTETQTFSPILDSLPVDHINPDLTANINLTVAKPINSGDLVARGIETGGPFELDENTATRLNENPDYQKLIVPIVNGKDVTAQKRNAWVIDFGQTPEIHPESYEDVYKLLYANWQAELNNKEKKRPATFRENWWEFRRSGEKVREILTQQKRYLCTPRVAKHRLFVWIEQPTIPDSALYVFARDDDYFFGVLHSRLHEVWSLRMGTSLEDRPRYTPTTTFETFPFPWSPGQEDTASPHYQAITAAAKALHEEREAWLNPDGLTGAALKDRTLTNLYNALNVFRGTDSMKIKKAAGDFAPRLDERHRTLDEAVCAAYGWDIAILDDEESMLRHLLALNLERC